jgi:hypothetical protein
LSPDEGNKNAIYPTRASWGFPADIQVPSFRATGEEIQYRGQNSYDNLFDPTLYAVDPHGDCFDNLRRDSATIPPKEEGCLYDDGTQNPADSLASLADHKASYSPLFDNLPCGSATSGKGWAPNPASHLLGREVGANDGLDEFQDDNAAQSSAGPTRSHDHTISSGNRWTDDEIDRFEEGARRHGKHWHKVADFIGGDRSYRAVKKFAKTARGAAIMASFAQESKLMIVSDMMRGFREVAEIAKEVIVREDR